MVTPVGGRRRVALIRSDRPGIALLLVVLVTMVVAAIAAGAALIGTNSLLISEYDQRSSQLAAVADAGLELARARLNADPTLYNDTALATLEVDATVHDVDGAAIPGVTRTVHVLPVGGGAGEYGNYAAVVAIATGGDGARLIRRADLLRESFASYAYFTHDEPSHLAFGNQDAIHGPVHSNADLSIRSTGASFHGPVTTAGAFDGAEYAEFHDDTTSGVMPILMPTASQLERLERRAEPAHLAFTAPSGTVSGAQAAMRIEFVTRDIDGDGVKEGFIRVYQSSDGAWVTAGLPTGYATPADAIAASPNCGYLDEDGYFTDETVAREGKSQGHGKGHEKSNAKGKAKGHAEAGNFANTCYLGGSEILTADGLFDPTDGGRGTWLAFPGSTPSGLAGAADGDYLFPLDRRFNPGFRGVIFVRGSVVVDGTVRSRVTVAATGNIIIGDDIVYETDPGAGGCTDILGLFAGQKVIVADNTINAPQQVDETTTAYTNLDDTADEFIHASILALDRFEVETPASGATAASVCGTDAFGNPLWWGRGCLRVTGGIIQHTRGMVTGGGGSGYIKRYTYDTCGFSAPPPYFPSTGHFYRGRYYEIDPNGFDIADYFEALN